MPVDPLPFLHRPPAGKPPDSPRQPGLALARAHPGGERRVRAGGLRQPARHLRQRQAGHAQDAAELGPHRIRRAGFLPAAVCAGRRGTEAADGAGGRAPRRPRVPVGVGSNLAKLRAILDLARTLQSSFSIDDVLVSVVDTALDDHRRRARIPAAARQARRTGDARGAQPARAEPARDRSARAARSDPPRAASIAASCSR